MTEQVQAAIKAGYLSERQAEAAHTTLHVSPQASFADILSAIGLSEAAVAELNAKLSLDETEAATPAPSESGLVAVTESSAARRNSGSRARVDVNQSIVEQAKYGTFIVDQEIGEGRSCRVLLGHDETDKRKVAIKVPRNEPGRYSQNLRQLKREITILESLDHPAVPAVLNRDLQAPIPYIVLDFIEGQSFAESGYGQRALKSLKLIAEPLCEALAQAHELGVPHLGLNGKSIMVRSDGSPGLLRFGHAAPDELDQHTLPFMAPEQLAGEASKLGPRTGVWAFGVLLYIMLFGRPPVAGSTPGELMAAIQRDGIAVPTGARTRPGTSRFVKACLAALAARAEDRPTMSELLKTLTGESQLQLTRTFLQTVSVLVLLLILSFVATLVYLQRRNQNGVLPQATVRLTGLPMTYKPFWRYRSTKDLRPDIKDRWEQKTKPTATARTRSLPRPNSALRVATRLRTLKPLFSGKVRLKNERVHVTYESASQLTDVDPWAIMPQHPIAFRALLPTSALSPSLEEFGERRAWTLTGASQAGPVEVRLGSAIWREARVRIQFLDPQRCALQLKVGDSPAVVFDGAQRRITVGDSSERWTPSEGWTTVTVEPGGLRGERLRVSAEGQEPRVLTRLDDKLAIPMRQGTISLTLLDGQTKIGEMTVEGLPLTADLPRTARVMQRLKPGDNLRISSNVQFDEPGRPGTALFRLEYERGRTDIHVGERQFELYRDGRLALVQALEFPGGNVTFLSGAGRWRFEIANTKPFWYVDGTIPESGDLTLRIGCTGRTTTFSNFSIGRAFESLPPAPTFVEASTLLTQLTAPHDRDGLPWSELGEERLKRARASLSLFQPFLEDSSTAVRATTMAHSILAGIITGDARLARDSKSRSIVSAVLDRLRYDASGKPCFISLLLRGLALEGAYPEVALAAVQAGLAFRPDDPDGLVLEAILQRDTCGLRPGAAPSSEQRAILERTLASLELLEKEAEPGQRPRIICERAWTLALIGRTEPALALLDSRELESLTDLTFLRRGQIETLTDTHGAALESLLAALARQPLDLATRRALEQLAASCAGSDFPRDFVLGALARAALSYNAPSRAATREHLEAARGLLEAAQQRFGPEGRPERLAAAAFLSSLSNDAGAASLAEARAASAAEPLLALAELRLQLRAKPEQPGRDEFGKIARELPLASALASLDNVLRRCLEP